MKSEKSAEEKFIDLRQSGYTGWIDEKGDPVEDIDEWIGRKLSR